MMYYGGWTLGGTAPFHFFVGLAQSSNGGETFERGSEAPVLGRNRHDPFLAGAPWVLRDSGMFRMWYAESTGASATGCASISWRRNDEPLLTTVGPAGNSEMVCYGSLLQHDDLGYLLYNGNAFDHEGFGVARMRASLVG